jgi:microcystin-dependent protein
MSQAYFGEIRPFGFNFAPTGWAQCNGQLMSIAQNQALFAILGTTYGGDGRSTFALPDLRGRMPVHCGTGAGLAPVVQGQQGGQESVTLSTANLPPHSHAVMASADSATTPAASGNVIAAKANLDIDVFSEASHLTPLTAGAVAASGGSQAHDNMQPSLGLNFCISLFGIFPSRN